MRNRRDLNTMYREEPSKRKYTPDSKDKRTFPVYYGLMGIIFLLVQCVVVFYIDGILPKGLKIEDEKENPEAFIAERSQNNLKILTDIGPKMVGTHENEVLALEFIVRQIKQIQTEAEAVQEIEFDTQKTSGSYIFSATFISAYNRIQNIIVKLHGLNETSSLLINSHYDSAATSPGASDDGIMVTTMLEILRKMSKLKTRPKHDIIFLFNGAEETGLHASHAFITQHKWAKQVKVFVNLEAAGSGGKETLFQTGPEVSWLLKYYKNVPHPFGQAAGEEIFQSNIIPSDTDFRIFRDFGSLVGYDFAFARNGYRYHTKYDAFEYIPLGSYQHVGDNILELVKQLANAPEVDDPKNHGREKIIYYDFLGIFIVSYSQTIGTIINAIVGVFSISIALISFRDFGILDFQWKNLKTFIVTFCTILMGWFFALAVAYLTAVFLDKLSNTMSWYNKPYFIFGIYCAPIIAATAVILSLTNCYCNQNKLNIGVQSQIQLHVVRIIWTIVLLIGTAYRIRAVYSIMIPVAMNTLLFIIIKALRLQYSINKWQPIYIFGNIFSSAFLMYIAIFVSSLLIPIFGRFGPRDNPELFIAFIAFFFTISITSYYLPLITVLQKQFYITLFLLFVFVTSFILVFTPLGFPYSISKDNPTPQRMALFHINKVNRNQNNQIINEDSGIFVSYMDRNSERTLHKYVEGMSRKLPLQPFCEKYMYCGVLEPHIKMLSNVNESAWIPFEKADIEDPITVNLTSKQILPQNYIRLNFEILGPSLIQIILRPLENIKITKISLTNSTPVLPIVISVAQGEKSPLKFSVDVEAPANWSAPVLNFVVVGKDFSLISKSFEQFTKQFPPWTNVITATATEDSYYF